MNISEITHSNVSNTSNEHKSAMNEALNYFKKMSDFMIEEIDDEKVKQKYETRIRAKLEAGKKLSHKEMQYLKKYNPALYAIALRVEIKRRTVEERLEHAKSKKEVEDIQFESLATIRKEDPAKKYMIAAVQDAVKEFKETEYYKRLPENEEEEGKRKSVRGSKVRKDSEEHCEEDKYVVTYEFGAGSYQMAYVDIR